MTLDRLAAGALAVAAAASRIAAALAAVAVLLCFALVCVSVAMRYFFSQPFVWSDEATGWLIVAVVMLGAAETQRRSENIGVDLLYERSGRRVRRGLSALGALTVAVAAFLMILKGIEMVDFSRMLDLRSITLGGTVLWPVQALVPLGAGLLLVVALAQLFVLVTGRDPPPRERPVAAKGLE